MFIRNYGDSVALIFLTQLCETIDMFDLIFVNYCHFKSLSGSILLPPPFPI
jgi:hypothetical protein